MFTILAIIAGLVLISLVNSERNKRAIREAILAATGYELTIAGDINFTLFPSFGLTLNDVRLRNPAFNQELASISSIALLTDVRSLLRREFYIQELNAYDLHVNVYTDRVGKNIWEIDSFDNNTIDSPISDNEQNSFSSLSFGNIRVESASIDIQNTEKRLRYSINNLIFNSRGTNIQGRPFGVNLDFNFLNNSLSSPLPMSLRSTITANINNGNIDFSNLYFTVTPMLVNGAISISGFNDNASYEGTLESNNFDIMGLMQTLGYVESPEEFSPNVVSAQNFSFNLRALGDTSQLSIDDFSATLGSTEIQANGDIRFATEFVPTNVRYEVITSSIDFSPFTLTDPRRETQSSNGNNFAAATTQRQRGNSFELSFASLNSFNVLGSIAIESITAKELVMRDVNLFTNVEDGVLDIELQPTSLYGGSAEGLIRVDSRNNNSSLEAQLVLNQLNITEFAPLISRHNSATGQLNIEASYAAAGSTTTEMLNNLSGSTTFAITQNTVDIGLIKQVFTAIAALSPSGESIQQWPDFIQFSELGGSILLEDGITDNQELKLRMDNFDASGTGGIDLESGSFDYDLEFAILGPPIAQTIPINDLYHNVPWPITCNARFVEEVSQYCRPDFSRVREIFTQLTNNEFRNRLEQQIIDQVPADLGQTSPEILRRVLN